MYSVVSLCEGEPIRLVRRLFPRDKLQSIQVLYALISAHASFNLYMRVYIRFVCFGAFMLIAGIIGVFGRERKKKIKSLIFFMALYLYLTE